ncbi:MAG: hypothetical protein R3B90_05215 [Planctomycetaceae bacterium]
MYVSAWIKCHYPAAFVAALLNSQPMGFYAPAQLIDDARKHGVTVLPVDINHSDWDCTLEPQAGSRTCQHDRHALRLGMRQVRGLSEELARSIVTIRGDQRFTSFHDFTRRTNLSSSVLRRLARADACRSLQLGRRQALWESLPDQAALPLFDELPHEDAPPALPRLSPQDEVIADYRTSGLSLRGHPVQFIREWLSRRQVVQARELATLPVDQRYKVAGLVLLRQRPGTAKGITFVTLEDETGPANLIIRQEVWERNRAVASQAGAVIAHGQLQRVGPVIHLLVDRLQDLSRELAELPRRSRDFH